MVEAARAGGRSPDVIVVGGGVTGTSIAWRLAQAGHRVLLLERRGICAGASGRNAGNTGAGSRMHAAPRTVRALHAHDHRESSAPENPLRRTGQGLRAHADRAAWT